MNNRALAIMAAGLLAVPVAASAVPITSDSDPALLGSSVETFNSAASGTYTSLSFADVTLTSQYIAIDRGFNGQYAPPNPDGDAYVRSDFPAITFTFGSAVSAFGFVLGAVNERQRLTAYDAGGNEIESLLIAPQFPDPFGFYGLASTSANIVSFTLTGGDDIWVLDDLRYASSVSEPGTLGLLGLGLAGLGFARRRKTA